MTPHNSKIQALVSDIGALLQPYGVVGVRLDYLTTDRDVSRRVLMPERHFAQTKYAVVSPRDSQRPKGLKAMFHIIPPIEKQVISEADASRVLDLADELSDLNDMGAWPFQPDTRVPDVATYYGVGSTAYAKLPGFKRRYHHIRKCLASVARIDMAVHVGTKDKASSRKAWMHFYDDNGDQVAAIPTNVLATSLRQWYGTDDAKHVEADAKLGRWAHQLNAPLDAFMDIALDLLQFDTLLEVTGINLREPA